MLYKIITRTTGVWLTKVYPRPSTKKAVEEFGNKSILVAEVGTDEGENARDILSRLKVDKIYLIDPYESYETYLKSEPFRTKNYAKKREKEARKSLSRWKDKTIWIKKYSDYAVKDIPVCDFVYIDGNHEYEYVKKDIENYWKRVRKGGILAGHDINLPGVSRAVCEFVKEKDHFFTAHKLDWWIIKK